MIEDVISVYYGDEDTKMKNLKQTEIMSPEIPEHGDIISVDGVTYLVQKRIFNADSGEIAVIAVKEERFIHHNAAMKTRNQAQTP
jgi:hypothetical protein